MSATPQSRADAAEVLRRSAGQLTTAALNRMDSATTWFAGLSAEHRSWIGLITQAAVLGFADWYAAHAEESAVGDVAAVALPTDTFGAAHRAMAGVVNLQQTVELIRIGIDEVEANLAGLFEGSAVQDVHSAILRYGREIAFATATVYARAAEARGAWDARLESLVVDAVLRADPADVVVSRASAVGWDASGPVCVVIGSAPEERTQVDIVDGVRRSAAAVGLSALCAAQGQRLVVVLGGVSDAAAAARLVAEHCGAGPVVHGPAVMELTEAHRSAQAAESGLRAAVAVPDAPRPVSSEDLLPERAVAGDAAARSLLADEVYLGLREEKGTLIETLDAWFGNGQSVEATARALFVHPNTVRYRLRQVAETSGLTPTQPRDAYALRLAITLGRLTHG